MFNEDETKDPIVVDYENGKIKPIEEYIENAPNSTFCYEIKRKTNEYDYDSDWNEIKYQNSIPELFRKNYTDIVELLLRKGKGIPEMDVQDRGRLFTISVMSSGFMNAALLMLLDKIDQLEKEINQLKNIMK